MQAAEFESTLKKEGFDEILTKELPANMNNDVHEHTWDVRTLVLAGEIALIVDGVRQTYREGQEFKMQAGCRHSEAVGPEGVKYIVGRRHKRR
jgi:quercetin dioxygenase-like cupin family protein